MITALQHQLTQFGLNPCEWTIEIKHRLGGCLHVEVHSAVYDLRFEGWVERRVWMSLRLCEF